MVVSRKDARAESANSASVAAATKPTMNSSAQHQPVSAKPLSSLGSDNSASDQNNSQSKDQATMREELHLNLNGLTKSSNVNVKTEPTGTIYSIGDLCQ